MQRSERLSVVVDLAKRDEEAAAKVLQSTLLAVQQEQQRLQDLQRYYDEYDSRFRSITHTMRAEQLGASRQFLQQLKESCTVQQQQILRVEHQLEQAKGVWREKHLKHDNLKKFVQRVRQEEIKALDQLEQKAVDDWVVQTHGRRTPNL